MKKSSRIRRKNSLKKFWWWSTFGTTDISEFKNFEY